MFVAGALPDESVVVELHEERASFARGSVVEVLAPSPYRREAQAPYGARAEAPAADAAAPELEKSGSAGRLAAQQQLGTGHGGRVDSAATVTRFERESSRPNQVLSLYYDATEALIARGVLPPRWSHPWQAPEAFPVGFAPDP